MSTDTILDDEATSRKAKDYRVASLVERIESALLHVSEWSDVPDRDSCARCDEVGDSEWTIQGIEGGYHGLLGDEHQARFIALLNPRNVRTLLDAIAQRSKGRAKS